MFGEAEAFIEFLNLKNDYMALIGIGTLNAIENYNKYHKIKKGDTVLDVGAHIGYFTKEYSSIVGRTGRVIAIEPDYRCLGTLLKNTFDNRANIEVIPFGLWSSSTKLDFHYNPGWGMSTFLIPPEWQGTPYYSPVSTDVKDFDCLLNELNIEHIDFIKMDIEGSEIEALRGMTKTLVLTDALAIASYHKVMNGGKKTFSYVEKLLKDANFDVKIERGFDGEIVYANRII